MSNLAGLVPALETAHAVAWVLAEAVRFGAGAVVVINISGRGDNDVAAVAAFEETTA